jgi:hypothetical protein
LLKGFFSSQRHPKKLDDAFFGTEKGDQYTTSHKVQSE